MAENDSFELQPKTLSPIELEAALWRQEHRFYPVLKNFFILRKKLPEGDPRREAAWTAFIYWLISPGSVALVGGTAVAILTLVITSYSVLLLKSQNSLLREQNLLTEASRRASLNFELTAILDEIDEEMDEFGYQKQAEFMRGYVTKSDFNIGENSALPTNLQFPSESSRLPEDMTLEFSLKNNLLFPVNDTGIRPRWRDRRTLPLFKLSDRLQGRIAALSRSFRPYIFLDDNGHEIPRALSPERGQLLLALVQAGVDMEDLNESSATFAYSFLENVDIHGPQGSLIDLQHTDFSHAEILNSSFNANTEYVKFNEANLNGSKFYGLIYGNYFKANLTNAVIEGDMLEAILCGAYLEGATIGGNNWDHAKIKYAFVGKMARVPEGFIDWAITNGALTDYSEWKSRTANLDEKDCYI